jgi:uncharacterized protein (TIGR02284 family)
MDKDDQVSTLETLTTTVIDSINGYEDAARNTDNERLRDVFDENARNRRDIAANLGAEIRRMGGDPPSEGSFMGKTHQTWLDLKSAVAGHDEKAIINSVEAGEDYLKEKFESALDSDLSGEPRQVVEHAYQSIRSGHDEISRIKHQMEPQG